MHSASGREADLQGVHRRGTDCPSLAACLDRLRTGAGTREGHQKALSAVDQHFPSKGTVTVCVLPFFPGYFSSAPRAISVITELMFPQVPTL